MLEPLTFSAITALGLGYAFAIQRLSFNGVGHAVGWRLRIAFALGWVALAGALIGPIENAAHETLTCHMVQHLLLVSVAAPLIALGTAPVRFASLLSGPIDRLSSYAMRELRKPTVMVTLTAVFGVIHAGAMWAWHLPVAYEAALSSSLLHVAEHATFFLSAALVWSAIFGFGSRNRGGVGVLLVLLFLAAQGALLGVLMAYAPGPWYSTYGDGASVLADQQTAGLIMWSVGGIVPVLIGSALVVSWIERSRRFPRTTRPLLR